jgi:hypothetical protein
MMHNYESQKSLEKKLFILKILKVCKKPFKFRMAFFM